jgi:diguanylate cyclase (GGDEF)-like protein
MHKNLKIKHGENGGSANGQDPEHTGNFGERLIALKKDELQQGKTIFLTGSEMKQICIEAGDELDPYFRSTTLVPLVHAGNFKAALCLVHYNQERPLPRNDMMMVADLADRVAVVVSHAELFAQVERQAVTDPMTGLYNRRYFQEQLSKEIDRFQRFGHAFSLFIVDLDFLKKINDSLGHNSGDIAIKHIANVIKRNVRDVDTVGRFGGEEFVVLLPETDVQHARMVSERICAAIREKPIDDIGIITASLGSATYPHDAQDRDKLFELADQALFLAKRMGRNQVRSVSEDLIPGMNQKGESVIPITAPLNPPPVMQRPDESAKSDIAVKTLDLKLVSQEGLFGMLSQVNRAIEERELYDPERSKRASDYATKLAQALHFAKDHAELVMQAAVYSNLGKLDVPEEVLRKAGPLSVDELEVMRRGPSMAAKLLAPAKTLQQMGPILEAYQERWDGSGYPRGLTGDDIPMEARIVAVVDAFVAMTAELPYRKSMSKQEAMQALKDGAGKDYDPRIVKIFLSLLKKESTKEKAKPN